MTSVIWLLLNLYVKTRKDSLQIQKTPTTPIATQDLLRDPWQAMELGPFGIDSSEVHYWANHCGGQNLSFCRNDNGEWWVYNGLMDHSWIIFMECEWNIYDNGSLFS